MKGHVTHVNRGLERLGIVYTNRTILALIDSLPTELAHLAAAGEELAGDGGTGQRGVFRAATPAGALGSVRLHAHGGVGSDPARAELPAPDLSLRADVFELGSGHGVLFRELRKPVRRTAERNLGTG